jgi:RNA-directed DNA polymerase
LGKTGRQNASGTQSPKHDAPSALIRECEAAKRDRKAKFTALLRHVTIEKRTASFYALKRRAAP